MLEIKRIMPAEPRLLSTLTTREFGELFIEYDPRFTVTAYRYVRDHEVAADLVSDSFISFWESRDSLPDDVNIPAYILTIVKNKCLNYLRDKALHFKVEHDMHQCQQRLLTADIASLNACDPESLFQTEILDILQRALTKMPQTTRDVFLKSRFNGLSYNDIAKDMNIATTNVHFEIRRSLKILREEFKDYLIMLLLLVFLFV